MPAPDAIDAAHCLTLSHATLFPSPDPSAHIAHSPVPSIGTGDAASLHMSSFRLCYMDAHGPATSCKASRPTPRSVKSTGAFSALLPLPRAGLLPLPRAGLLYYDGSVAFLTRSIANALADSDANESPVDGSAGMDRNSRRGARGADSPRGIALAAPSRASGGSGRPGVRHTLATFPPIGGRALNAATAEG